MPDSQISLVLEQAVTDEDSIRYELFSTPEGGGIVRLFDIDAQKPYDPIYRFPLFDKATRKFATILRELEAHNVKLTVDKLPSKV